MLSVRALYLWISLLFLLPSLATAQFATIPELTGLVVDTTGVLGAKSAEIEQTLRQLKTDKGSEVAVLIVSTTKPETIEQYSIRVVEKWKLGRKGVDDGALLLVALGDRTVRIEVGRGLEGDIPDLKAHRIIDEQILPRFRQGDIVEGVEAGVNALVGLVRGMDLPPPASGSHSQSSEGGIDLGVVMSVIVFAYVIGSFISLVFGHGVGALGGGLLAFAVASLAFSVILGIVLAVVSALAILFLGAGVPSGPPTRGGRWTSSGTGSSYSGGSFGGGSFGGGGTFSGGGASGRW